MSALSRDAVYLPPETVGYWLPGLVAGGLSLAAFILLGDTSIIRAGGLALVIVGMTMILRHSGFILAVIGGLSLAFSPAFWSQTGGVDTLNLPVTLLALALVGGVVLLLWRFSARLYLGLAAGLVLFAVLFWLLLAEPGSLRLTTFCAAWLLYLLVDALYRTNPRPEGPPPADLAPRHIIGLPALFLVGVINDPLFAFLAPALLLGLFLSGARLPSIYWGGLLMIAALGLYGVLNAYVDSAWWLYPVADAEVRGVRVPFMMAGGWREASRWLLLMAMVVGQFTLWGALLGVVGLARLARWYPPIGSVTLIAYASYTLFGLIYFGRDATVLLLPLFMIQVFWMTYAVEALRDWLTQGFRRVAPPIRWLIPGAYSLLPLVLLLRITAGM